MDEIFDELLLHVSKNKYQIDFIFFVHFEILLRQLQHHLYLNQD